MSTWRQAWTTSLPGRADQHRGEADDLRLRFAMRRASSWIYCLLACACVVAWAEDPPPATAPGEVMASPQSATVDPAAKQREPDQKHAYKRTEHGDLELWIWLPPDWQADDSRPAILFFHGGAWNGGSPKTFMRQCSYFSARGMVAVSATYRTRKPHGTSPRECIADGRSAMRWVRARAATLGLDPQRIAAGGESAGGHVAAGLATIQHDDPADDLTVSCTPQALILLNPVLDTTETGFGSGRFGADAQDFSPLHHIPADLSPTIIFNGDEDGATTVDRARAFSIAAQEKGRRCELVVYAGATHSFFMRGDNAAANYMDTLRRTDRFLTSLGMLDGEPLIRDTTE